MVQIDMEIPKSCAECPCCQPDGHFTHYGCGIENTDVLDEETGEPLSERPEWCPMKEV